MSGKDHKRSGTKAGKRKRHKADKKNGKSTPKALPAPAKQEALLVDDVPATAASALEKARSKWEHGEWEALLALDGLALAQDPARAKLALLLAAAHSHEGSFDRACTLISKALAWGVSRNVAARVLISAVQNSLARVAAALEEEASASFEEAIRLVLPHGDADLLGRNRRLRELARLGLLPQAAAALEHEIGLVRRKVIAPTDERVTELAQLLDTLRLSIEGRASATPAPPKLMMDSARKDAIFSAYRNLPSQRVANFRYLDVKSLPRSGLHFMRNTFEAILRDSFSFCEWYQEPGCCRQMPCALTAYATEAQDHASVRMVKSHDFHLTDPVFETGGAIRRIVLMRDPLYMLTSWWTLEILQLRANVLKRHGIMTNKINFAHGPQVVQAAYRILDAEGEMPSAQALTKWLNKQVPYTINFTAKWHDAVRKDEAGSRIVRYSETPAAIVSILNEIRDSLDEEAQARLDRFRDQQKAVFKERTNPFVSGSKRISEHLAEHLVLFQKAAEEIIEQDKTLLLK